METGFLNFHDEEHFSTMPMTFDNGAMLDDSDGSVLDASSPPHFAGYKTDPWGSSEEELNGDIATLPGPLKNDFGRMHLDWDHLAYTQCGGDDNIYDLMEPVAEIAGLELFDESSFDGDDVGSNKRLDTTQTSNTRSRGKRLVGQDLSLGHFVKEEAEDEEDELLVLDTVRDCDPVQGMDDAFLIDIDDDDEIDVETVNEQIPVLEAVDMSSLLEQFEASENVNECVKAAPAGAESEALDTTLVALASKRVKPALAVKPSVGMSHQSIIDALPKEVIDRIKASGRKKAIPVIPAMPSRRLGKAATRMQDAGAALTRNKLLKIVSPGVVTGESIQLDHDYCSGGGGGGDSTAASTPRSFYHSDAAEYALADRGRPRAASPPPPTVADGRKDSRKDSGLESGESGDDNDKSGPASPAPTADRIVTINGKDINLGSIMQNVNNALVMAAGRAAAAALAADKQMVSVLKRGPAAAEGAAEARVVAAPAEAEPLDTAAATAAAEPKKRKLNLSEYRSRVKVLDRPRGSAESSRPGSPLGSDTPTLEEAKQIFEQATQMLINAKGKINEESFAQMKRTLEKQAAIRMPAHMLTQQEEARPRREAAVAVAAAVSPRDSRVVLDVKPAQLPAKLPVREPAAKNLQETTLGIKQEPEAKAMQVPAVKTNKSVEVVKDETRPVVATPATSVPVESELSVVTRVPEVKPVAKTVESDVPIVTVGQTDVTRSVEVVEKSAPKEDTPVEASREAEFAVEECPIVEKTSAASVGDERTTLLNDLEEGKSRDRSRRHYRSRRAESSSSSSVSASRSRSPRRSSTSARSVRSRSSSSRDSSRSSGHSKSRGWQRDSRTDRRHRRRPTSNRLTAPRASYRGYTGRVSPAPEFRVTEREKERQVQERRVVYVGRLDESMTKSELRALFESYGPIVDISVHFREHGDNYGFVTFAYKVDAYAAVEQGKKDPTLGQYDLSFGGRRAFCKTRYADLDGNKIDDDYGYSSYRPCVSRARPLATGSNFDDLLREALKSKVGKGKA